MPRVNTPPHLQRHQRRTPSMPLGDCSLSSNTTELGLLLMLMIVLDREANNPGMHLTEVDNPGAEGTGGGTGPEAEWPRRRQP